MDYDALINASGLPRTEARALLEHASGRTRTWLIAHGDEQADPDTNARFATLADARKAGAPLAYLIGWREFHGHRFSVGPAVLIPRPETEMLVDAAIARAPAGGSLIDLGTGSGCIAISIALARPDLHIVATDASAEALAVAQRNAQALVAPMLAAPMLAAPMLAAPMLAAGRLQLRLGDWWQAVDPDERFDLIVSNPPYIAAGDRHLSTGDLRHEPAAALTDQADGLSAITAIVSTAIAHIKPGGALLLEHGFDQGEAVRRLLTAAGWRHPQTARDAAGLERMTHAIAPDA